MVETKLAVSEKQKEILVEKLRIQNDKITCDIQSLVNNYAENYLIIHMLLGKLN